MTKVWTVNEVESNLLSNPIWVEKAIVALFNRQTISEHDSEVTTNSNNVGFTAFDASKMSYYAKWCLNGRHLSGHHLDNARKKILKYKKQLTKIANKEI